MKYCPQCTTGFPDDVESCPIHSGILSEIIDLKLGMLIRNTYRIVRKLGEGGFGSVYLAEHTLMDNDLRTVKFLSRQWSRATKLSPPAFDVKYGLCGRCGTRTWWTVETLNGPKTTAFSFPWSSSMDRICGISFTRRSNPSIWD